MAHYIEEAIIYMARFQGSTLDFRGQLLFRRYDQCEFVKCTILIDDETENLAFTGCSFEDCNIGEIISSRSQGIVAEGNVFKLPIEQRKAELHRRLVEALALKA